MSRRLGDDASEVCQLCGKVVKAGHYIFVVNDYVYCSMKCAESAYQGRAFEVSKEYLWTAEDKEEKWGLR